jgi:hypothetical protein
MRFIACAEQKCALRLLGTETNVKESTHFPAGRSVGGCVMDSRIRSAVGSAVDVPKKREAGLCAVPTGLASLIIYRTIRSAGA